MVNETYRGWLTFAVERKINGAIFDTSAVSLSFLFFLPELWRFIWLPSANVTRIDRL
jgi:hypothetical protein